jgi:hypothetical protein
MGLAGALRKETAMSNIVETHPTPTPVGTEDLTAAIGRVLQQSSEPLTVPKIKALLPVLLRGANLEETLQRQVAAKVLQEYPKYRSQHERYWDRPMPVHVAALVHAALAEGPLAPSELRRKLPAYAHTHLEDVVKEHLAQGKLHRHPKLTSRGGERVGLLPAHPREYLKPELAALFERLAQLGFAAPQVRQAALELLHEEEWSSPASGLATADRLPPTGSIPTT